MARIASGIFQLSHDGFRGRSLAQLIGDPSCSKLGPKRHIRQGEITTVTKAVSVKELKVGVQNQLRKVWISSNPRTVRVTLDVKAFTFLAVDILSRVQSSFFKR